ncbi:MAG: NAD(P)H-hydrate dehydratase [Sphingomonadales bacterium]|nr:NAD(P)H-hydrate dehydratase [Sphingomonadales bacterium]
MPRQADQILTVAQMRAAEEALIGAGSSVDALMQIAGRGAADYVWRIGGRHHRVTVLCGPGNNGGDGYVIAEAIRERGGKVAVLPAVEPKTAAAKNARALYRGEVLAPDAEPHGEVFVDCLFGSGLTRPLSEDHVALLGRLVASHRHAVAVDLPSGVESDTGALLNPDLPGFDLTIALGAWKFAHFLMPASATMGAMRLVDIGVDPVRGAATVLRRPKLAAPAADAHKYRRGLLAVVGGAMPGAALLACKAAQGGGAGYVKLLAERAAAPADLVVDATPLTDAIADKRIAALLIGPGLGRNGAAQKCLAAALGASAPAVLDADALLLLDKPPREAIATPHEGEFKQLEKIFACAGEGAKPVRALALARASGMVIVAKGPDTVIAAPDGRLACAARASSWLSVAGTGDVLAGAIASRLATGAEPFVAACEGVWLHGEAARLAGPALTAGSLAEHIPAALAACL